MATLRRYRVLLIVALAAGAIAGGVTLYSQQLLDQLVGHLVASELPFRVQIGKVSGNLIYGLRLSDVRCTPEGQSDSLAIHGIVLTYDVPRSLMLRDRHLSIALEEPALSLDLEHPVFDPAVLRALARELAARHLHLHIEARDARANLTHLPRLGNLALAGEATAEVDAAGHAQVKLTAGNGPTRGAVGLAFDLAELAGKGDAIFTSSALVQSPVTAGPFRYATPLEGRCAFRIAIRDAKAPAWSDAVSLLVDGGRRLDLAFGGTLAGKAGVVEDTARGTRLVGVNFESAFDPRGLSILDGSLGAGESGVRLSGQVPGFDAARTQLTLALDGLPVARLSSFCPWLTGGKVSGGVDLSPGSPAQLHITVQSPAATVFAFDAGSVEATVRQDQVVFRDVRARAEQGSAHGIGSWGVAKGDYTLDATFLDFPHRTFGKLLEGFDIQAGLFSGRLQSTGVVGDTRTQEWRFDFQVRQAVIHHYAAAHAHIKGMWKEGKLVVDTLDMDGGPVFDHAHLALERTGDGPWHARGDVQGVHLEKATQGLIGNANLEIALDDDHGHPTHSIKGEVKGLAVRGSVARAPALAFSLKDTGEGQDLLELADASGTRVSLKLPAFDPAQISVASLLKRPLAGIFRVKDLRPFTSLWTNLPIGPILGGAATGSFEVQKADGGTSVSVQVDQLDLSTSSGPVTGKDIQLEYGTERLVVKGASLSTADGRVEVSGSLDRAGRSRLHLALDGMNVMLPMGGDVRLGGRAYGNLEVAGSIDAPHASGALEIREASMGSAIDKGLRGQATVAASIDYEPGRLTLSRGSITSPGVEARFAGTLPLALAHGSVGWTDGPADLTMTVPPTDASLLQVLVPSMVKSVRGKVSGKIAISGTGNDMAVNGGLDLDCPSIRLGALPEDITSMRASIGLDGKSVVIRRLSGETMGGHFSGSGQMPLAAGETGAVKVLAEGMHYRDEGIDLRGVRADTTLTFTPAGATLGGKVTLAKGDIQFPLKRGAMGSGLVKEKLAGLPIKKLALDVRMDVSGNLWVKSSNLDAELKGELTLAGDANDPKIHGELRTQKGAMRFQRRSLAISDGLVRFARPERSDFLSFMPLDSPSLANTGDAPYVDFTGQTDIDGVKIFVELSGLAVEDGMSVKFRSLPVMEESRIKAVLLTGSAAAVDPTGKDVQAAVASAVSGEVEHAVVDRHVEQFMQRFLGVDDVRLTSHLLNLGGSNSLQAATQIGPELTLGKYLAPNLYVSLDGAAVADSPFVRKYGIELRLKKDTTVGVERQLAPDINLGSSDPLFGAIINRNTTDDTRVDIKQTLRFW